MKILHLSDFHMCPEGQTTYGLDPFRRLNAVIDHINENHADADICVVTGDLTDAGDEASYTRLQHCLGNLTVPFMLTLGNHDKRGPFRAVFGERFLNRDGFVQSKAILAGNVRLLLLDTLDEAREDWGLLCEARMAWLKAELAADSQIPTILFLHHPPADLGENYFRSMLLSNGEEVLEALGAGNVRHIAFGHVHFSVAGQFPPYSFSSSRGTSQTISTSFSQPKALIVERSPSYGLMLWNGSSIVVHHIEPVIPSEVIGEDIV